MADLEQISNMKVFDESIPTGQSPNSVLNIIKSCFKKSHHKKQNPIKYDAVKFMINSLHHSFPIAYDGKIYKIYVTSHIDKGEFAEFNIDVHGYNIGDSETMIGSSTVQVQSDDDLDPILIHAINTCKDESSKIKR